MNLLVRDAMPPPPPQPDGYAHNHGSLQSHGPSATHDPSQSNVDAIKGSYIAFGILYPIAVLFLLARCYTALRILRRWRVDDTLILIAWLLITAAQCLVIRSTRAGVVGVHIWDLSPEQGMWDLKVIHATTLLVVPGTVLAKVVLCVFYYRLSPYSWYRYSILATAGIMIGAFVAAWFAILFTCVPVQAVWDYALRPTAKCIDQIPLYIFQAVMSAWSDFMLIVLPLPNILTLEVLSTKKKIGLVAWFCTGLLTLGSSVARLVTMLPTFTSDDSTHVAIKGSICMIIESNLLILCGCLPTFRLFLHHVTPRLLATGNRSSPARTTQQQNQQRTSRGAAMVYAMRTIGGGSSSRQPRRRHFDSIDDDDDDDGRHDHFGSTSTTTGGAHHQNSSDWELQPKSPITQNSDEEIIIKTVQTSVTYGPRSK